MLKKSEIKRILVLRYRFIGDTVLTIPFIQNLKENFPDSQIDVLVSPNSGELLENNPDINKVIYFDNTKFHKYENNQPGNKKQLVETYNSFFACAKGLRNKRYDLAFVLKRSFSSALLAALAGIKHRIGFNTEFRSFLLTKDVKYDKNLHELDNFLNNLKILEIEPKKYTPKIFCTREEDLKMSEALSELDPFKPKILIHATSAHPYKMWSTRYFAKLMDTLFEKFGAQFVFTGAEIDKSIYRKILNWSKYKSKLKFINLCGVTSIRECFSIYKKLDMAICVDSGNAHIAAASSIPTYVIYGPTKPEKWLPVGEKVFPLRLNQLLPCQPCDVKISCSHISCMKLLTPEYVFGNLTGMNKKGVLR